MDQLAGRLKWERTESGIRVEFPAILTNSAIFGWIRHYWTSAVLTFLMAFTLVGALQLLDPPSHAGQWWELPLWLALGMAAGDWMSRLPRRWIMELDPTVLELEQRDWGIKKSASSFPTEHLYDLRFVRASPGADIRNGFRLDEIQFDKDFKTQYFAPGITEQEACALIARMMEIYPFSKRPAAE